MIQKLIMLAGLFSMSFACLMPPWQETLTRQSVGYAWIWYTPYQQELKAKSSEARRIREHMLAASGARVDRARRVYARVRGSATELKRETLGGFSLDGAILREAVAKAELNDAISERAAILEKPAGWWMEQPANVEVNMSVLAVEMLIVSIGTVFAAFTLASSPNKS